MGASWAILRNSYCTAIASRVQAVTAGLSAIGRTAAAGPGRALTGPPTGGGRQARPRIRMGEVELVDLRLLPGSLLGSSRLVGRVRNRSPRYTLTQLRLMLTMRDCTGPADGEVVGESEEFIFTKVPPGQARDLDESVHFSKLGQPRGKRQWDDRILEILGK
jgi:hypothetical protein